MQEDYKPGALEFAFEIEDRKTGEKQVCFSTPSMWGRCQEYLDAMKAKGGHTPSWMLEQYVNALVVMAASSAGIWRKVKGIPGIEECAEFANAYDAVDVTDRYRAADDQEDPTQGDRADSLEAQ